MWRSLVYLAVIVSVLAGCRESVAKVRKQREAPVALLRRHLTSTRLGVAGPACTIMDAAALLPMAAAEPPASTVPREEKNLPATSKPTDDASDPPASRSRKPLGPVPPYADRVEGELEFDKKIVLRFPHAWLPEDALSIVFSNHEGRALGHFSLVEGPDSFWRETWGVHVGLLDDAGRVVAADEQQYKNETMISVPFLAYITNTLDFDLGPWEERSAATRFAVTVEHHLPFMSSQLKMQPGKSVSRQYPFKLEEPVKIDLQHPSGCVTEWIVFRHDEDLLHGELRVRRLHGELRVRYPSGPKAVWKAGVELLDEAGKTLASGEARFENRGLIRKRLAFVRLKAFEFDFGHRNDLSDIKRIAVTIEQLTADEDSETAPPVFGRELPLSPKMDDIFGNRDLRGWGVSASPWFAGNATDKPATIRGVTLPARGVAMHPGADRHVAVGWRSPIVGQVSAKAKVSDGQPGGGNGIDWCFVHEGQSGQNVLLQGAIDRGGSQSIPADSDAEKLAKMVVWNGDTLSLVVGPRNDHNGDTTVIELVITEVGGESRTWDLARDVVDTIHAGNPHADSLGNPHVWSFYTMPTPLRAEAKILKRLALEKCHIEGTYRIGDKPAANRRMRLNHKDCTESYCAFRSDVETDAEGRFVFETVCPGRVIIGERFWYPLSSQTVGTHTKHTLDLNLKPGQTVQVTLGGSGRPVVGRALLPEGIDPKTDWAKCRTLCELALQDPEVPYPPELAESERETWYEDWKRSPEGKAFRLAQIRCGKFPLGADGSLRIEDVPAGKYSLTIRVSGPPIEIPEDSGFNWVGGTHNPIGAITRKFAIPSMPEGRSDEPFDLGPLQLLPPNVNAAGKQPTDTKASSDPKARGEVITTPPGAGLSAAGTTRGSMAHRAH